MENLADYRHIFLNDVPMMDVRAPVEFAQGAFPGTVNLPLMNDSERQQVGTCYKQRGQQAAIALGHTLVSGDIKRARIQAWADRCADAVMRGQPPVGHPAEPRLRGWMDGVFLRALASHPGRSPDFFMGLAESVPAAAFARFMSDQASWRDQLRVMAALPPGPFLRALPSRAGLPA